MFSSYTYCTFTQLSFHAIGLKGPVWAQILLAGTSRMTEYWTRGLQTMGQNKS
jgi:hypothetical protein